MILSLKLTKENIFSPFTCIIFFPLLFLSLSRKNLFLREKKRKRTNRVLRKKKSEIDRDLEPSHGCTNHDKDILSDGKEKRANPYRYCHGRAIK